jgi:two-component system, LuxR family, response regulator FixJ
MTEYAMVREPTIFIVDDDEAIRDSLQLLLESAGFKNVKIFGSSRRFLDQASPQSGDCLLLDVQMPDMDGLDLQEQVASRGIRLAVIVMTGHGDVPIAVRAIKAGAVDFIEKPFPDDLMLGSIRRALAHAAELGREREEAGETLRRLDTLTAREREVLDGMVEGQPNKVIAYKLGISPRTVEIHRARVMEKMQARSLSGLVRMVLAAGVNAKSR